MRIVNKEGYSKTFIERFLEQNVFCQTDTFGRTVSGKGLVLGSDKTEPCHWKYTCIIFLVIILKRHI